MSDIRHKIYTCAHDTKFFFLISDSADLRSDCMCFWSDPDMHCPQNALNFFNNSFKISIGNKYAET